MFLTHSKALLVDTLRTIFDERFPEPGFRDLWVSIEYPVDQSAYPGIWVDFVPSTDLQVAGIGHEEFSEPDEAGTVLSLTRWRFAGMIHLTCVALTSQERDLLVDEVIRVISIPRDGVSGEDTFRKLIEDNDLIAMSLQWDTIALGQKGESPGTPWGTDEIVYEMTVTLDCMGEFVTGGGTVTLVPLSSILVETREFGTPEPEGDIVVDPGQIPPGVTIYDRWI